MKTINKILILVIVFFVNLSFAFSQWECPSQIGSSLRPIGESKLMWGHENTWTTGYLAKNSILNSMNILSLNYANKNTSVYAEGGMKYWKKRDTELNTSFSNFRLGVRELFIQNTNKLGKITAGLQSMKMDENILLNERALGLTYKSAYKNISWQLNAGTVTKDFARNGTFCNVAYLYDIFPQRNRSTLGNNFGETNFAGFTLSYQPEKKQESLASEFDDGLGNSTSSAKKKFLNLETVGLVYFNEFGNLLTTTQFGGIYSQLSIANWFQLKPEVLYQFQKDNEAILYCLKTEKSIDWGKQRTAVEASYFGQYNISKSAVAMPLFSNIFAGSVIRLDCVDMPFYQAGVKHSFAKIKTHIKLQMASQTGSNPMREYDVEVGKKFFGKFSINANYGLVRNLEATGNIHLFKTELRLFF